MQVKLENNLHYAQLPLNILFSRRFSRLQFYAGGGGYVNYGFSGTSTSTLNYTMANGQPAVTVQTKDVFKEKDGGVGYHKTDFGVAALAGIHIGRFLQMRAIN